MTCSSSLAMQHYSIEPRTTNSVEGYGLLSFLRTHKNQLLDTWFYSLKIASKKVVHKTGKVFGNEIADAVNKSNNDKTVTEEPFEEIIVAPEKREEILNIN